MRITLLADITEEAEGDRVTQRSRNLARGISARTTALRLLAHETSARFTAAFAESCRRAGIAVIPACSKHREPARSPRAALPHFKKALVRGHP